MRRFRRAVTADDLTYIPSSASSIRSTILTSDSFGDALEDWMYWQRDANNTQCWTKVYGRLENEFMWLFKGEKSTKTLFMQIAVSSVEVSGERQLRIVDPNGEDMEIWLLDEEAFATWRNRLEQAAILTTEYFRVTALEAKKLPRSSAYRGSLVTYRRVNNRARCMAALAWITGQWKKNKNLNI